MVSATNQVILLKQLFASGAVNIWVVIMNMNIHQIFCHFAFGDYRKSSNKRRELGPPTISAALELALHLGISDGAQIRVETNTTFYHFLRYETACFKKSKVLCSENS